MAGVQKPLLSYFSPTTAPLSPTIRFRAIPGPPDARKRRVDPEKIRLQLSPASLGVEIRMDDPPQGWIQEFSKRGGSTKPQPHY